MHVILHVTCKIMRIILGHDIISKFLHDDITSAITHECLWYHEGISAYGITELRTQVLDHGYKRGTWMQVMGV